MEVRSLIQPSAKVTKITEIREGDVYKRLVEQNYADTKIVHGVVLEVLNNGEQASIVALEFTPVAYTTDIKAETKVFSASTEVAIFPATREEYLNSLQQAIEVQEKEVEKVQHDLQRKQSVLTHMVSAASRNLSNSVMQEITQ